MHGVFNQSWTSVLSASLVTLRRSFSDDTAPISRVDAVRPRGRSRARFTRSSRRAVSARQEGRAARGLQSIDRARRILSEELFKDVLLREWKRAERFSHPFVLLLVELHEDASEAARGWDQAKGREGKRDSGLDTRIARGSSWGRVVSALGACTRQTDVMGWFVQQGVLAVIMTEVGQADQDAMARLEALIRRQLGDRLSPEVLSASSSRCTSIMARTRPVPRGPVRRIRCCSNSACRATRAASARPSNGRWISPAAWRCSSCCRRCSWSSPRW